MVEYWFDIDSWIEVELIWIVLDYYNVFVIGDVVLKLVLFVEYGLVFFVVVFIVMVIGCYVIGD